MSLTVAEQLVEMVWRGKHADALLDTTTRELDIEGAIRAGKTTIGCWRELNASLEHPGIHGLMCRWTEDGLYGLVVPVWRGICAQAGIRLKWHPDEAYDELPNKSRVYFRGLRSQDATLRYSKFRGLTVARVYADQAEELPRDVYLELAGRLSQPGYPHQITITPQSAEYGHWLCDEFPEDDSKRPHRRLIQLSIYDNAHNLPVGTIEANERLYPPNHPKHRTLLLGQRGMNVIGDPVYAMAFLRVLHEGPAEFDPALPLEMALDYGKHHPCVVFRQRAALGQTRYLGGILGQDFYLDDFCDVVLRYRSAWFPGVREYLYCCDPAGAADTSHGTPGGLRILETKGLWPMRFLPDSNSPAVRLAMIERIAAQMRKRAADRTEAFMVSNSDRWLRISTTSTTVDRFLADGFEAGYVWDEHMISVGRKQVRKPRKDGWYEHGQNCAEYLEANFGASPVKVKAEAPAEPARPGISPWR